MEMKVVIPVQEINLLGGYNTIDLFPNNREVFLDGTRASTELERIILKGLDTLVLEALNETSSNTDEYLYDDDQGA